MAARTISHRMCGIEEIGQLSGAAVVIDVRIVLASDPDPAPFLARVGVSRSADGLRSGLAQCYTGIREGHNPGRVPT